MNWTPSFTWPTEAVDSLLVSGLRMTLVPCVSADQYPSSAQIRVGILVSKKLFQFSNIGCLIHAPSLKPAVSSVLPEVRAPPTPPQQRHRHNSAAQGESSTVLVRVARKWVQAVALSKCSQNWRETWLNGPRRAHRGLAEGIGGDQEKQQPDRRPMPPNRDRKESQGVGED